MLIQIASKIYDQYLSETVRPVFVQHVLVQSFSSNPFRTILLDQVRLGLDEMNWTKTGWTKMNWTKSRSTPINIPLHPIIALCHFSSHPINIPLHPIIVLCCLRKANVEVVAMLCSYLQSLCKQTGIQQFLTHYIIIIVIFIQDHNYKTYYNRIATQYNYIIFTLNFQVT